MNQLISGMAISRLPIVNEILKIHFRRDNITLELSNYFPSNYSQYNFVIIDDSIFFSEKEKIKGIITGNYSSTRLYSIITQKSYKNTIQLLNSGFYDYFELPLVTEVVSKKILNHINSEIANTNVLKDNTTEYNAKQINEYGLYTFINPRHSIFISYKNKARCFSKTEKRILDYLLNCKRAVSINELAYIGWNSFEIKPNTVVVTMKKIRAHLQHLQSGMRIVNIYGYGYKLTF